MLDGANLASNSLAKCFFFIVSMDFNFLVSLTDNSLLNFSSKGFKLIGHILLSFFVLLFELFFLLLDDFDIPLNF